MLTLERRRAERSRKPFVLMVVDARGVGNTDYPSGVLERLPSILFHAARETDLVGWYEANAVLAILFTEVNLGGATPIAEILHRKIATALRAQMDPRTASKLRITAHLFPETLQGKGKSDSMGDSTLYPDLSNKAAKRRLPIIAKRGMDIVGGALILILSSPIMAAVAVLIKLTSKGPAIFQQERVGEFGKRFKCLKFRTMYVDNSHEIHREYVRSFISGDAGSERAGGSGRSVYKITNDPRVTPIGRFLRKTSLDEFPQFWNVLRGEMSLVGPRPPVVYEFEAYDFWHRRRVLEVKPGVTGLWQVMGRSRTCFDEMVRLDLRYSRTWSIWLDLRILLATPRAVILGDGAF